MKRAHLGPFLVAENVLVWYNELMEKRTWTLREVGEKLGVSGDAVRRLCDAGLIPQVGRNRSRYRVLEEWQIDYAQGLLSLRSAGVKKSELRKFARLMRQGDATLRERKAMLETRKRQLWQELTLRQQGIDFIERQIELIDQELGE